jgi:hypothetical protein
METVVAVCGFLGAWLLVAGPLHQGALELIEHDLDPEGGGRVPPPPAPPIWWWLLPPVMLVLRRRRTHAYNQELLRSLTTQQRIRRSSFLRKATGWFIVASGATLLAVKETWELTEHAEWPVGIFAVLLLGVVFLVGANTIALIQRQRRLYTQS